MSVNRMLRAARKSETAFARAERVRQVQQEFAELGLTRCYPMEIGMGFTLSAVPEGAVQAFRQRYPGHEPSGWWLGAPIDRPLTYLLGPIPAPNLRAKKIK